MPILASFWTLEISRCGCFPALFPGVSGWPETPQSFNTKLVSLNLSLQIVYLSWVSSHIQAGLVGLEFISQRILIGEGHGGFLMGPHRENL